jgi:hypothetical protein
MMKFSTQAKKNLVLVVNELDSICHLGFDIWISVDGL